VFLHLALSERDPIELYQHLPLPFSLGKLTVTLKSEKEFIAVDALGTYSMELSNADLSNCHVLAEHTGNLFVCPHMNLLRRHPKSTCLGALLVGSDQALNLCTQAVEKAGSTEYATQISDSSMMLFQPSGGYVSEQCQNGTRNQRPVNPGINFIKTSPGCRLVTSDFIFNASPSIEEEGDFIEMNFDLDMKQLIPDQTKTAQLEHAHEQLSTIQDPNRRDLSQLRAWVRQNNQKFTSHLGLGASVGALLVSVAIAIFILALYLSYKRSKNNSHPQG
jgi:hypothetical protein